MRSINALLAALLLSGILGVSAAPVMADEVDADEGWPITNQETNVE